MTSPEPGVNTHGYIMAVGRHKGEPITRVPVSYLRWMVGTRHSSATYAQAELDRRGTVTPDLEVSGHAIDRASQSCLDIWQNTRNGDEGLHAWLARMAALARIDGKQLESGKIKYRGMKFAFEDDGCWPVLKTVMRVG